MATKTLSNEFMQKIMTEEAWKDLSSSFNWSETMLEKYQDKVDWNDISTNTSIRWTVPMIQKFKRRINWDKFSEYVNEYDVLTENIIETFKDKWNWHKLSRNSGVNMSFGLLDKFADLWDWDEIIDSYLGKSFIESQAIEFYERYKDRISVSKMQDSYLWQEMVEEQKRQLIGEITS